jgi:hypothetical protein
MFAIKNNNKINSDIIFTRSFLFENAPKMVFSSSKSNVVPRILNAGMCKNNIKCISLLFQNKKIKKIVNVYQKQNYKNGPPQGFGDYLRGCFCLLQISNLLGIEFDMDINNHPISKYIGNDLVKYHFNGLEIHKYTNLNYFAKINKPDSYNFLFEFINHLNNNISGETYFLFCNSFPIFMNISPVEREIIQSKIEPKQIMWEHIDKNLNLIGINNEIYQVLHIRCGDNYIIHKHVMDKTNKIQEGTNVNNKIFIYKLFNLLRQHIKKNIKYIVISDNNDIKIKINSKFPNCVYNINNIQHLGASIHLTDSGVMDTLLDFYIMALSDKIISISSYSWGSGFSKWCSVIYDIPYSVFII